MTIRREWHFVYGDNGIKPQGWEEDALGWRHVSQYELDNWKTDSCTPIEWAHAIPTPITNGPPRELCKY